jgi:plasmid segregation protein ParM
MKWYGIGDDFGNSGISTAVSNGSQTPIVQTIPTAIKELIDIDQLESLGQDLNSINSIRLHNEDISYILGDFAQSQYKDSWNGRGDILRYASKYHLVGLLSNAASVIPDREFGIYVVTGLPATTFIKKPELRGDIKKALDGTYVFTIDMGKTWRTAVVEVVNVIMEGAGALLYYGAKSSNKDEMHAVIDIGGRTTDLFVAQNQRPQQEYCQGKPIGVETAADIIKSLCEQKHDLEVSDYDAQRILRAFSTGGTEYPTLTSYGKQVPWITQQAIAQEAVTTTAGRIVSFVASAWNENERGSVGSRFSTILNIGGGTFYFNNALKQRIPHLSRPSDPVHANALGYCTLASRLGEQKQRSA